MVFQPIRSLSAPLPRQGLVLLALAGCLAFAGLGASAALATVTKPVLTGTHPESPGATATPRVVGLADGVVTHAAPIPTDFLALPSSGGAPVETVGIYATPDCSGPLLGSGSPSELSVPGIEVTPLQPGWTIFYANVTQVAADEAGEETSQCSDGLSYRYVTSPPSPPVFGAVTPASPADDNQPRLSGSAASEAVVSIYADPTCAGAPLAAGAAAAFAAPGIEVAVPDNSTTTFYAKAAWDSLSSACSTSSISYQEVSVPPGEGPPSPGPGEETPVGGSKPVSETPVVPGSGSLAPPRLAIVGGGRANDNDPLVGGSAAGASAIRVFGGASCEGQPLARGSVSQLAAGLAVHVGDNTTTQFFGLAIDADGKASRCSQSPAVYVEDSTPPQTRITLGPSTKTRVRSPAFRFADVTGETGATFSCKLDQRRWQACQAPWRVSRLSIKVHVVRVRAVDSAGNREPVGVKRRFKVVRAPR